MKGNILAFGYKLKIKQCAFIVQWKSVAPER